MNQKEKAAFKKKIDASNKRISEAVQLLSSHSRGKEVLRAFRKMCMAGAAGLDSVNSAALVTLTKEIADGRRDFITDLPEDGEN